MLEPAGWMKNLVPFENWGYNKYSCDQLYNIEKDSWLREVHLLGLLSISVTLEKIARIYLPEGLIDKVEVRFFSPWLIIFDI